MPTFKSGSSTKLLPSKDAGFPSKKWKGWECPDYLPAFWKPSLGINSIPINFYGGLFRLSLQVLTQELRQSKPPGACCAPHPRLGLPKLLCSGLSVPSGPQNRLPIQCIYKDRLRMMFSRSLLPTAASVPMKARKNRKAPGAPVRASRSLLMVNEDLLTLRQHSRT